MGASLAVVLPNRDFGDAHFEGFGLVAPEAASAGGIILASDLDGFRDSVIDNLSGRLLPPNIPEAWIEEILHLYEMTPKETSQ